MKRYWGWELVWLAYSIANALAITFIGAGMEQISGKALDTDYLILYLLAGTLVWSYLSVVFEAISEMISWERWEGTIEYTFMAPISRLTQMIGTTLFAVGYGVLRTLIILAVVLLLVGSISFIGFGILAAVLPLLFPERGSQMTHVVQAALLLISGVYYPVEVLPVWMQKLALFSPVTYVLRGIWEALLRGAPLSKLWSELWPLALMGLGAIPLGLFVFRIVERSAKRTGRLKRSGWWRRN